MEFHENTNLHVILVIWMKIYIIPTLSQSGFPGIRRMHETLQITRPNWCFWSAESHFRENDGVLAEIELLTKIIFCAKSSDERKTGIQHNE